MCDGMHGDPSSHNPASWALNSLSVVLLCAVVLLAVVVAIITASYMALRKRAHEAELEYIDSDDIFIINGLGDGRDVGRYSYDRGLVPASAVLRSSTTNMTSPNSDGTAGNEAAAAGSSSVRYVRLRGSLNTIPSDSEFRLPAGSQRRVAYRRVRGPFSASTIPSGVTNNSHLTSTWATSAERRRPQFPPMADEAAAPAVPRREGGAAPQLPPRRSRHQQSADSVYSTSGRTSQAPSARREANARAADGAGGAHGGMAHSGDPSGMPRATANDASTTVPAAPHVETLRGAHDIEDEDDDSEIYDDRSTLSGDSERDEDNV